MEQTTQKRENAGMIVTTYMLGNTNVEEFHDELEDKIIQFQLEGFHVDVQYATSYVSTVDEIYHSAFLTVRVK